MTEDTTLDLAIVRNRLLAGKADHRDRELLMAAQIAAGKREAGSPYVAVFQWAIANALSDIESGAFDSAAREVHLVHNIRLSTEWSTSDEEYFLKGTLLSYIEQAPVDRIKALLAHFAR